MKNSFDTNYEHLVYEIYHDLNYIILIIWKIFTSLTELKYLNKYLFKYKTNLLLGFFIIIIARILLLFTPGLIRESVNVIDEFRKGNIISIETVQTELIQNIFLILLAAIAAGIFTFLTRQTIINVSEMI